jgi:predicted AAA+ superfamily ATPase
MILSREGRGRTESNSRGACWDRFGPVLVFERSNEVSYQITISGHIEGENTSQQEIAIVKAAKEFAQSCEGVQSATMSGQHTGVTNLLEQAK